MRTERVFEESVAAKRRYLDDEDALATVERVGEAMAEALAAGDKVVLFGNGGSAADAQHIAAELSGKFRRERPGLPAVALTTNTSSVTAIANDFGYETVFARQVEGMVSAGDVVVGISTSGTSENVLRGIEAAADLGATTVGLTGESGGDLAGMVDHCVTAPSADTARIQEVHITVGHAVCGIVEGMLFD
ncbi:D-sedoheptulose-7-phosphate isomerase [Haloarcula litorea]|uniref:D-sedoheptulose-7-phosphate isomerase n=1 Tax=Haloarcula litorea TaxID=3032579 RepID=UPI0023E7B0A4|nr:D-sedoheptulose 7-phosphate isomerase [Halomicroarcula sp. GDY20]